MVLVRSLRFRATLLMCGLLLAAVAAYAAVAYDEIVRYATDSAHDRLHAVSSEFSGLLAGSAVEMRGRVDRVLSDTILITRLRDPEWEDVRAALGALAGVQAGENSLYGEVVDASGRRLGVTSARPPLPLEPMDMERAIERRAAVVGGLRTVGDTIVYPVVGPVMKGAEVAVFLVRWRRLSIAGGGRDRLEEMIGSGARMYMADAGGGLWTDFDREVPAPDVELASLAEVVEYSHADGTKVVGTARPVAGTPWVFVVEFPRAGIVAGAGRILQHLLLFGLLLLLVGGVLAWLAAGRLTGSMTELAGAARALTDGDYSRRVGVQGDDEIATLAGAFNTMAAGIAASHQALERKFHELAALEAQHRGTLERLEHVITSSRTMMYELAVDGDQARLVWISENIRRLLGHEVRDALEPGWWYRNLHPEDQPLLDRIRAGFLDGGEMTHEYRLRNADGEYRLIRDEQRVLTDEAGRNYQVVGTMADITEWRQLHLAKDAAEAASRAKSEFLSRMSHELRTPMNSILGFAQLLSLELQDEGNLESAEHILRGGRHLLQLIDEVLDIARIESGSVSMSVEPVIAEEVLRESADLVRTLAEEREITLRIGSSDALVSADRQRLKQILLNLLSNAVKYNRKGGTTWLGCEPHGEGRVRIFVQDDGPGIAPEAVQRMFMPFERLGAEHTGIDGTGLGLSLSKGFAEAMGGTLGVRSEPGAGSRFWIELATAEERDVPEATAVRPSQPEPDGPPARKVLYIEDNASNFHLVERLLRRYREIGVIAATQGRLGLQLARQHVPDLILLDVHLPDMMGDEVLAELQRDEELRSIPVIVISADATPLRFERMIAAGAREYITKPFDVSQLLSAIDLALETERV